MKRIGGVLAAAIGVIVLAAPTSTADPADGRVPVGVGAATARADATASGRAAVCDDIPEVEWPPAGVTPPGHSADKLREFAAAMSKSLDTAFPATVPDARDLSWVPWGGEWTGVIEDGQDYLTTWAVYSDELGSTGTAFQIEAPGHFPLSPRAMCAANEPVKAAAEVLGDGSLVLHTVVAIEGDRTIESALHYRADGTVVWVAAYDYDPIFDGTPGPDRDVVALTTGQLTALATNPDLHL